MLNRYMSLFLLLSICAGMQCAQPQAKPFLPPEQAAIFMNPMLYGDQKNWDTIATGVATGIACSLFKRYPDITRKELVGFFRRSDEQGRERACVLPLPMLEKIWEHIEYLKFINKFRYEIRVISTRKKGSSQYLEYTPFTRHSRYLPFLRTFEMHNVIHNPIDIFLRLNVENVTSIEADRNNLRTNFSDHQALRIYFTQNYAHVLLATREKILAVPHVSYRPDATSEQELTASILQTCENCQARFFPNYVEAFAYLRTFEEQQPQH